MPAVVRRLLLIALVLLAGPAAADDAIAPSDAAAIQGVIQGQMNAFKIDDWTAAFAFAAPSIQTKFESPQVFRQMVTQAYQPVYRPRVFEFREIVTLHGQVTQKVHVVGPDGRPVTAYYPMTQLPDGSWRINGCYLQAPEEHQA